MLYYHGLESLSSVEVCILRVAWSLIRESILPGIAKSDLHVCRNMSVDSMGSYPRDLINTTMESQIYVEA